MQQPYSLNMKHRSKTLLLSLLYHNSPSRCVNNVITQLVGVTSGASVILCSWSHCVSLGYHKSHCKVHVRLLRAEAYIKCSRFVSLRRAKLAERIFLVHCWNSWTSNQGCNINLLEPNSTLIFPVKTVFSYTYGAH